MTKFVSIKEAVSLVEDEMTLGLTGFVTFGIPEDLMLGLRDRYRETKSPKNLTLAHGTGIGDGKTRGGSILGEEGLVKKLWCAHVGLMPGLNKLVAANKIACFMIPQGVTQHMWRAIAGKKVGVVTHVGLKTFADPRLEGCKANDAARQSGEEVVEVVTLGGKEQLFYKAFPIDICFIKASLADEDGNLALTREAVHTEQLEMAAATHNSGGIVIAQVEKVVARGSLKAQDVKIHKFMVDYVVVGTEEYGSQTFLNNVYTPEWSGEMRVPVTAGKPEKLGPRKVIGRRAAFELTAGSLVNLGIGVPDSVAAVANEEGFAEAITLSIESGVLGGVPLQGLGIGGAVNPTAMYKHADIFDIYDGGGIDLSCLGAAQIDAKGNVNVSKFAGRVVGPGGFINISQNTKKVCFCGTLTAGDAQYEIGDGKLTIVKDADGLKFVKDLEQVTFSAEYALQTGQTILYITERAVFELTDKGLLLTEIAPGVDLEKDVLAKMEFKPLVAENVKLMDARIFCDAPMGLTL